MGFLSDLVKFQNVFSKDFTKDIFDKPQRLLTGIDPASTKVWNKVLGRDDKPLVNVFGSPGQQYYDAAAAKGIDTKAAGTFHGIADMIAGIYGAQGIAGIGGAGGPAGKAGITGDIGKYLNKGLTKGIMEVGNGLNAEQSSGNNMSGFDFGDMSWMDSIQSSGSSGPSITDVFSNFSSSGGSSSGGSFWNNLLGQLGKAGDNAKQNPLGALSSLLGAYGSYQESQGGEIPPGMLNAVDQLMMKGDTLNAYTSQPVAYKNPVARDFRHYIQSFDKEGNATQESRNDALTNDAYQQILGRNADVGGLEHYSGVMDDKGMTSDMLKKILRESSEFKVNDAYKNTLGRPADFHGFNFYKDAMDNRGLSLADLRNTMLNSTENAVNAVYLDQLGRRADPEGLEFYQNQLNNGLGIDAFKSAIAGSPEAVKYKASKAPAAPSTPTAIAPPAGPLSRVAGGTKYEDILNNTME